MLFPQQNIVRESLDLSGIWDFQADPQQVGEAEHWWKGLPEPRALAVPGSWNEQLDDMYNYLGAGWYFKSVYLSPAWQGRRIFIRVGSANYGAVVWINGQRAGSHEGGHLPFELDITEYVDWSSANQIAIRVENELKPTRVPAGNISGNAFGLMGGYPSTTFDFFPYAGIHRPVILYAVPETHIRDISVATAQASSSRAELDITVSQSAPSGMGKIRLVGQGGAVEASLEFTEKAASARLVVENPRLWCAEDPFLYTAEISLLDPSGRLVDHYSLPVGIRTIEVRDGALLLNGKSVFLKGFGRHEDFYVSGKGLNLPLLVKDYGLLKWVGANSYRTSHYPYSEEEMMMADRQGILIIDEIPAVSMQFGDSEANITARLETCKRQLIDLVSRDKNHPSVIMWCVANEPMPPSFVRRFTGGGVEGADKIEEIGKNFLETLLDLAHRLDSTRPATLVGMMGGPVNWFEKSDLVCINRYWGWYTQPGQPEVGANLLAEELDGLFQAVKKPIIITEFGADTIPGNHSLPAKMWTEEYQVEFLRGYLNVAATRPFVIGLHVWNFADFQAVQSTMRVGGMNMKGVFSRDRRPKMAAHFLRERWNNPGNSMPASNGQASVQAKEESGSASGFSAAINALAQRLDGKYPGMNRRLAFDLGEVGAFLLIIEDGRCRAEAGGNPATAEAAVSMKVEDAQKLMSGKLNPMVAFMTGKIKATGNIQALMILQDIK